MREAQFNTELVNSLKYWGAWAHKIPDLPASMAAGLRFTPDKPCDVVGGYGKFFAIESKQIKKFEAFGMRFLRDSQIKELNSIIERGNRAFIFLNIRIKAVKGKVKRENRLVIFDWKEFRELKETIKKADVEKLPYITYQTVKKNEFDKDTEIIYNLKPFLESL
jgi:penicillin-binding protein-related factor A (putative recombinase)